MTAFQTSRKPAAKRRHFLFIAVGAVAAFVLLFLLVQTPLFLRYTVLPVLSREIGCSVTAEKLSLALFQGKLTVKGLQLSDGRYFSFRAAEADADIGVLSLFAGQWDAEEVMLNQAELEIRIPKDAPETPNAASSVPDRPLAAENFPRICIRLAQIREFTLHYRDESGPSPVSFHTSRFALNIKNWGVPDQQAEVRCRCPFILQVPGSVNLKGGRAELALNGVFDGGVLPREFSLSLGAGCLASFAGENRELAQNLVLRTNGSIDRKGKVWVDSFSLQQHTGGEATAFIEGSGSFGPAVNDFSLRIRKLRTLPQFWSVMSPLAGYQTPGRFSLSGEGDFAVEGGTQDCNFSFSGSRAAETRFPGVTFSCRGRIKMDTEKKLTQFSELGLDVKETGGPGTLTIRLARPMEYHWETGLGGAEVDTAVSRLPVSILRSFSPDRKNFFARSGECSGKLRTVLRRNIWDFGAAGMLSFSRVILRFEKKDSPELSGGFLVDLQYPKLKKLAGTVRTGRRELLKINLQGECGKDRRSGSFSGKGSADLENVLHICKGEPLSSGTAMRTAFRIRGNGGEAAPHQLRAELRDIPLRLIPLSSGLRVKEGSFQADLFLEQKSPDRPEQFRIAVRSGKGSIKQDKTLYQWDRADAEVRGTFRKDGPVRFRGTALAENRRKRLLEFTLKNAEYDPGKQILNTAFDIRGDLGLLPLPADGVVNRGTVSAKAALKYGPENWSADGTFQAKGLAGVARLPADGGGTIRISGNKTGFDLQKLTLDFRSGGKSVLALTAAGKLDAAKKGRLQADSSILDLDFLKKYCDAGKKAGSQAVSKPAENTPCCRIENPVSGVCDLRFRKVLIGNAGGALECHSEIGPDRIFVRSFALSFGSAPICGDAFFRNAENGVRCQLRAKVDRSMELRPVLQFFVPESLQKMRCRLERLNLLCQGTLPQWELWKEHLKADLHAGFGECVIPGAFGKGTFGRIILMPFEAIRKMNTKVTADEPGANESFMDTLRGIQQSARTVRFSRGAADIRLREGSLYIRQFQFKGDLVKDFRINGSIRLTGTQPLDLQTNTKLSGMDFPLQIGGTLEKPEVKAGKSTTDIVVKNTENLLNSLKDKVDWDTTLQ